MQQMTRTKLLKILREYPDVHYICVKLKSGDKLWFKDVEFNQHTRFGVYLLCVHEKVVRFYRVKSFMVFLDTLTKDHVIAAKDIDSYPEKVYSLSDSWEIDGTTLVLQEL